MDIEEIEFDIERVQKKVKKATKEKERRKRQMDLYSDVYQVSSRESFSGSNMKQKIGKAYMQNKRLLTLNKMMSSKASKPVPAVPIYPVNRFNSTIPPILSPPLKKDEAQIHQDLQMGKTPSHTANAVGSFNHAF